MTFTPAEIKNFFNGCSDNAYKFLGCHKEEDQFVFRVYAPNAKSVRLLGSFNNWDVSVPIMKQKDGFWVEKRKDVAPFDQYKFYIEHHDGSFVYKSDPYGYHSDNRPSTASKIFVLDGFKWNDEQYLKDRAKTNPLKRPINIYEFHFGSWRKYADGNFFSYRVAADELVPYLSKMGYTHVELMPISEHPFDGSWGYQVTGYYAPTSRYGTPHDFMYFVDKCHSSGIGVILDWVGAHFTKDECGLYEFDGTCLYESADPTRKEHPEWGTRIFDYGRNEVRSFLISNVCFWLREYHIDGIRVDAVTSMIYLDYSRKFGEWKPNCDGGNINYEAVALLRDINRAAFRTTPGVIMAAEESTTFSMVTKPGYDGGLGFNFKWNMGWMHDTLDYMSADPLMRKWIHNKLTFSMTYAFSENFILPFSHDEVVHGKLSLIGRMPGEYDSKFANLRVLFGYMMAHPGKKLSFMGNELAQFIEWDFQKELDWILLSYDKHKQFNEYIKKINKFYLKNSPLWENDIDWNGFRWIKTDDRDNGIIVFRRISDDGKEIICVFNFCPVERVNYRIGLPYKCILKPVLSSDELAFGGIGTEITKIKSESVPCDGYDKSAQLHIPPMAAVFYKMTYISKK